MSGHVTSHTSERPNLHGAMVIPSGRLPSLLKRPEGSSVDGILAAAKDLCTMLLMAAWREWRPALLTLLTAHLNYQQHFNQYVVDAYIYCYGYC